MGFIATASSDNEDGVTSVLSYISRMDEPGM